jgi:uncharacterized protein YegL
VREFAYERMTGFGSAFPFYLVIDVSPSMNDEITVKGETFSALDDIKEWTAALMVLLREGAYSGTTAAQSLAFSHEDYHQIYERGLFSIVAFGDQVETILPLTAIHRLSHFDIGKSLQKAHEKQSSTHYGTAFQYLLEVLNQDDQYLSNHYSDRSRPAVFFITDGKPKDRGWRSSYDQLSKPAYSPGIAALGFGHAKTHTIARIATRSHGGTGFVQSIGVDGSHGVIGHVFEFIINSVALSSRGKKFTTPGGLPGFDYVPAKGY